jgi:hypothetical protein
LANEDEGPRADADWGMTTRTAPIARLRIGVAALSPRGTSAAAASPSPAQTAPVCEVEDVAGVGAALDRPGRVATVAGLGARDADADSRFRRETRTVEVPVRFMRRTSYMASFPVRRGPPAWSVPEQRAGRRLLTTCSGAIGHHSRCQHNLQRLAPVVVRTRVLYCWSAGSRTSIRTTRPSSSR